MDKETLRTLVAAAKQQDPDAFAQLYAQYYKSLYKAAYYMIGNAQDAEDVVMDTVADAYASIRQLRDTEAFGGWLFKIMYNKARKKRGVNVYRATTELDENIRGTDASLEAFGDNTDLQSALQALSKEERSIVVLSVCAGYTSNEISAIMNLNHNTVRSKQMRALAKMRTQLEAGWKEA